MKPIISNMQRRKYLGFISITITAVFCTVWVVQELRSQDQSLSGFRTTEVRFDESTGDKLPTPTIPSSWRFIGVSNGEKLNSNNLWFQDKDGNVYLIQGFTSYGRFILKENIQKLAAAK